MTGNAKEKKAGTKRQQRRRERLKEQGVKEVTAKLGPGLLALLKAYRTRQKQAGYAGVYLFPRGDGDPITDNQAQEMIASLTAGEWTSHDLRKIARSMWFDLGVEYFIGEMLLNHAMDDLQAAYIHTHAETLKRDALERWHLWLEAQGLSFFAAETAPRRSAIEAPTKTNNDAA